jgi:crotonobetainyl-CoA:carnitine CoA-transferase CaiB-like acyl-CoA transferase
LHWDKFFAVVGLPELVTGDKFATAEARQENDAALARIIGENLATDTAEKWFAKLDMASVPVEIVDEEFSRKLHDNAEFQKRQWVVSYPHPHVGKLDQVGLLVTLSDTPGVIQSRPLLVGEHTREILVDMGYAEADMRSMEEQMAIGFVGMPRMPTRKPGTPPPMTPSAAQSGRK